jgi:hypothetical protein
MAEALLLLTNGYETIVDLEDLTRLQIYHWHAHKARADYYASRTTCRRSHGTRRGIRIYLHRFLMNAPPALQVDHINGDTLDNRKRNLELVAPEENLARRRFK